MPTQTLITLLPYQNLSQKKWKGNLVTRAKLAVLWSYVENQAILKPILFYRASKHKQTKDEGSKDCYWTHIFTFLCNYYQYFFSVKVQTKKVQAGL